MVVTGAEDIDLLDDNSDSLDNSIAEFYTRNNMQNIIVFYQRVKLYITMDYILCL